MKSYREFCTPLPMPEMLAQYNLTTRQAGIAVIGLSIVALIGVFGHPWISAVFGLAAMLGLIYLGLNGPMD